jgi:DNA-binding response OmpR family regulator
MLIHRLATVEQSGMASSVLVTDVNLGPRMDGVALAQEMRRRWSLVGLVVMTGDKRNVERLPAPLRLGCIVKPFSPPRLAAAVRVLLRRPDRGIGALPSRASTATIKSSGLRGG